MEENKIINLIGDYNELIDLVGKNLASVGIDITGREIDHIAYRTRSSEEFDNLKEKFSQEFGTFFGEKMIRGRRVCILKFNEPLKYKDTAIPYFEILEPAADERRFLRQLEHIEVVIDDIPLTAYAAKYPNADWVTKNLNLDVNPELILVFPNDANVKFHPTSIDKVIKSENN